MLLGIDGINSPSVMMVVFTASLLSVSSTGWYNRLRTGALCPVLLLSQHPIHTLVMIPSSFPGLLIRAQAEQRRLIPLRNSSK
jgi:hypothetical protein